ncbi:MAG: CHAT domain-containing protein [Candidatus Omnitrophica bacterium]|nr:CHAT domain-containing protein [Candidatus Omnitrophota bacterium]
MQEPTPLVLEISKQDKSLKMSLFKREELVSTLRHYSSCHVHLPDLNKLCQEMTSILNKARSRGSLDPELIRQLSKTGQLLWDQLLTRQVKEKLRSAPISDLILTIDEELINIPWELLYDGRNFLCLNFNLGRLIRTGGDFSPPQYRSASGSLKMLILANPTNDLRSAYLEGTGIKNLFDRRRNNVRIDFKSTRIDRFYVKKNFCDYDIVHFAGHCEYEPHDQKHNGWVLNDGRFSVSDIMSMGESSSLPTLVFSNACHSAQGQAGLIEEDYQEKNYSLAQAFLFSGVRHYIGSIRKIEDPVSLAFSREFYGQVISGRTVGESVRLARLKLIKEYGISAIHWTSYLLYGDPNFSLFTRKHAARGTRLKAGLLLNKRQLLRYLPLGIFAFCAVIFSMLISTFNPGSYYLFFKAEASFRKGDNRQVIALASRILSKDPGFLAASSLMGDTYQRLGEKEQSLKYYFDYALNSERKNDLRNQASAYLKIGWQDYLYGEYDRAAGFYQKALALAKESGDKLNEAIAMRKSALLYMDKSDFAIALELLTKACEINRERQDDPEHRYNLACDYFDLGLLFANREDLSAAKDFYHKSRAIFEGLKLKTELSDYYFNLGEIYLSEKEFYRAMSSYQAGLEIDEAQGNKMNLAGDYNMIAQLYVEMDDLKAAEDYFKRSVKASKELECPPLLAEASYNLGLLYKKTGRRTLARESLRQAQEIYRRIDPLSCEEVKTELMGL